MSRPLSGKWIFNVGDSLLVGLKKKKTMEYGSLFRTTLYVSSAIRRSKKKTNVRTKIVISDNEHAHKGSDCEMHFPYRLYAEYY